MAKRKTARRRRNPRKGALDTIVNVGLLAGAGYGAYEGYKYIKNNPNALTNLFNGQPANSPNGTANPNAAPFSTDTGYSTSAYGSHPV
jgi:hypothetical protein